MIGARDMIALFLIKLFGFCAGGHIFQNHMQKKLCILQRPKYKSVKNIIFIVYYIIVY